MDKNAQFIVTPDTGMMHIAAAFKKKIYVVWDQLFQNLVFALLWKKL
ncbi:MAG: hypothetical protein IPP53_15660 [Bacteroidetes bacterium]|nr:hypothetical protein [Bacteroidota bacterium]